MRGGFFWTEKAAQRDWDSGWLHLQPSKTYDPCKGKADSTSEQELQVAELISSKSQHPQTSGAGIAGSELVCCRIPKPRDYLD